MIFFINEFPFLTRFFSTQISILEFFIAKENFLYFAISNQKLKCFFKDLLMKWAFEMKKCNELMAEMAACQKVYEDKAFTAEQKLEDWKKVNRSKRSNNQNEQVKKDEPLVKKQMREDGREVLVDQSGQPVVDDSGREIFVDDDGNEYVEDEQGGRIYDVKSTALEKLNKDEEIRQTAAEAVARTTNAAAANGAVANGHSGTLTRRVSRTL